MLHRRRSAARRADRAAAASVRAIGRAVAARAARGEIAARVKEPSGRAARARAARAKAAARVPVGPPAIEARGRGLAAATAVLSPAVRVPTWVRPRATGETAHARPAELAEARAERAVDGAAGWS
jgi:hypothetical protein